MSFASSDGAASAVLDRKGPQLISLHDNYVDIGEAAKEIRYANGLMEKYGWRSIDVSYKAVEEVAKEVLRLIGREGV